MRKIFTAVLVAAAAMAFHMSRDRAEAMTPATPSQLGLAATGATPVQKVYWHRGWHAHYWRPRDHWGRRWYWGWPIPWFHVYIPRWHGWWGWHHHYHHWHHH
jgi:hypothetical protein